MKLNRLLPSLHWLPPLLCLVAGVFQPFLAAAQKKAILVDSVTMLPSATLPFDESFVLEIPIKSQRVTKAYCIEVGNRKTLAQTISDRLNQAKNLGFNEFLPQQYKVDKIGKTKYLIIDVNAHVEQVGRAAAAGQLGAPTYSQGLLAPGKAYAFLWTGDVSEALFELLDSYRLYRTTSDTSIARKALKTVKRSYRAQLSVNKKVLGFSLGFVDRDTLTFDTTVVNNRTDTIHFSNSLQDWYPDVIKPYAQLEAREALFRDSILARSRFSSLTNPQKAAYQQLTEIIVQASAKFDSQTKSLYLPEPKKAVRRLHKLLTLDAPMYDSLRTGAITLDCDGCPPTPFRKYAAKKANLKATIAALDELYTVAAALALDNPALAPAAQHLSAYQKVLRRRVAPLEQLVALRSDLEDAIAAIGIQSYATLTGSTSVFSFETRTKLSIAPDFGLVTTKPWSGSANPYPFVPYLGFHVNTRPINRDVSFKSYPHSLLHRVSVMVGWSLVGISNGPKQTARPQQDSVASFFKGKGTFLVGGGFRVSNTVLLTTGGMLYFKYSQNATTRVYDDRTLKYWPFVGVAIDFSFKDLFNGIADVFAGSPRAYAAPAAPAP